MDSPDESTADTPCVASGDRYTDKLHGLLRATLAVNSASSLDEMLRVVTEQARLVIGAHQALTSLNISESWEQMISAVSLSDKYAAWRSYDERPDGSGIYAMVCEQNHAFRMTQEELERHPRWRRFGQAAARHPPMRGWLAAPLVDQGGQNLGIIQLSDKYEGEFTEEDEAFLVEFAQIASVAVANARLRESSARAAEAAGRSERRLAAILNQALIGIVQADIERHILIVNDGFCRIVGRARDELIGLRIDDLCFGDGCAVTLSELDRLVQGKPFIGELHFATPDGDEVWVLASAALVLNPDERKPMAVLVMQDITPRKQAEQERVELLSLERAARKEAEHAARVRDVFLSVASHELRTPLSTLRLQLDGLNRLVAAPAAVSRERVAARLHVLDRQMVRLEALVQELLDVSRIGSDRMRFDLEPVDLAQVTQDVVARYAEVAAAANSRLTLVAPAPVVGQWDRGRLDQVVANLLSNALKYGAGKSVEVRVEGDAERGRLLVRDHGLGIAPAEQHRIFQRFERIVSDRQYGGLGLGLWIVQHIVARLGGTVTVESALGAGALFTVELPRQPAVMAAPDGPAGHPAGSNPP